MDWDELAFVVAQGRAEALEAVDRMTLEAAFMWLHYTKKAHDEAEAAAKRRR